MAQVKCIKCNNPYPQQGFPYRCEECGGIFDFDGEPFFVQTSIRPELPGLWQYKSMFDLPEGAPIVSLGEGRTPLLLQENFGQIIGLKMESLNPTGSYKDRGTAVLISWLMSRGAKKAVEDSSGNAGASFAAYAAQAGLSARVYVPESASGPKRAQIERYGAELVSIAGPRSATAQAVLKEVDEGLPYASHAYLPFGLAGIATIAFEIVEQLGEAPGSIIAPGGHGGLMLGIVRGFKALFAAGKISHLPYFVLVQAAVCAPMVMAARFGINAVENIEEGLTIAEGVRVRWPTRMDALLTELSAGKGEFLSISEEEILKGFYQLAHRGIYIEPTSALPWCALKEMHSKLPKPITLILTGSGLKYPAHL